MGRSACLLALWILAACTGIQEEGPETPLDPGLERRAPAANEVVVTETLVFEAGVGGRVALRPGLYRVAVQDAESLRLIEAGSSRSVLLRAHSAGHELELHEPRARVLRGERGAAQLALALPGGRVLFATAAGPGVAGDLGGAPGLLKPFVDSPGAGPTFTDPRPGETWRPGERHVFRWDRVAQPSGPVTLSLWTKDDRFVGLIEAAAPDTGSFEWEVPTDLPAGGYRAGIERPDKAFFDRSYEFSVPELDQQIFPGPILPAQPLAAGSSHSLVLVGGEVWAWGENHHGQLGSGLISSFRRTPAKVVGLTSIDGVAAGQSHSLALEDGAVWAWGDNFHGQLGNGQAWVAGDAPMNYDEPFPIPVEGLADVRTIGGVGFASWARQVDGSLWKWGAYSQSATGYETGSTVPVPYTDVTGAKQLAVGAGFALVLRNDGTVWASGGNERGQQGTGSVGGLPFDWHPVPGLTGVKAVAAGYQHALALKYDGTVWAWGDNTWGQCGDGAWENGDDPVLPSSHATPVQVVGLAGVRAIEAGLRHSAAIGADRGVWCWGANSVGQVGCGIFNDTSWQKIAKPLPVVVLDEVENGALTNVVAIAAGHWHTLALRGDGVVWAWGVNSRGQLGLGTEPLFGGLDPEAWSYGIALRVRGLP